MHYAEFAEDEVRSPTSIQPFLCKEKKKRKLTRFFCHQSAALLNAIKEYETNKWKVIGQKVGKPAKVSLLWLIVVRTL